MEKIELSIMDYHKLIMNLIKLIEIEDLKFDVVVGLSRGGLYPAVCISHHFEVPMGVMSISRYNDDNKPGKISIDGYCGKDFGLDKTILIVDDIIDEGTTMITAKAIWSSQLKVITASLYVKERSDHLVDYPLVPIPNDYWIVFPYELEKNQEK